MDLLKWRKKAEYIGKSLSDSGNYVELCHRASWNNETFNSFRSNSFYNEILEHVSYEQGMEYLQNIPCLDHFEEFKKNDLYGGPRVYAYPEIGNISPTTLRYIKILYDIEKKFGSLKNYRLCEIGVGYGGQCRLCCQYFDISEYVLLDLPPVLDLAKRYLSLFPIKTALKFTTLNESPGNQEFDLLISNYAFSEISRDIQQVYMEKIIRKARCGYIIYNEISSRLNFYSKDEILSAIPNSIECPEVPLTNPRNCVIVWDNIN